VLFIFVRF